MARIVRLKAVVAEARHLDPLMTGEVVETPGMEPGPEYVRVRWSQPVTVWGDSREAVWEYACDLEPVGSGGDSCLTCGEHLNRTRVAERAAGCCEWCRENGVRP